MKTIALIILASLAAPQAHADAPPSAQQICTDIGNIAAIVMTARQKGMPMSQVMGFMSGTELGRAIVMDAYDQPQMTTDEYRGRMIMRFRNEAEAACYRMMAEGA